MRATSSSDSSHEAPASSVIGSAPKLGRHPGDDAGGDRDARQARRTERRCRQQPHRLLAIGQRFGCDDPWVDRLGDAGDDAEPEDADHEDGAEDHRQLVGV